jgi:large subunit ribosomal protein L31
MKTGIHPKYVESQVSCACGNAFKTRGFLEQYKVDICNVCHPFFTGKMKLIDAQGRVDRFNKKYAKK